MTLDEMIAYLRARIEPWPDEVEPDTIAVRDNGDVINTSLLERFVAVQP